MKKRDSISFSYLIKKKIVLIFWPLQSWSCHDFQEKSTRLGEFFLFFLSGFFYLDWFFHYLSPQYSLSQWFVWTVIRAFQILSGEVLWQETVWWLLFVLHRDGSCDAFMFMENRGKTPVIPRLRCREHRREFGDVSHVVWRWRIANGGEAPFVSEQKHIVNRWRCRTSSAGTDEVSGGKEDTDGAKTPSLSFLYVQQQGCDMIWARCERVVRTWGLNVAQISSICAL